MLIYMDLCCFNRPFDAQRQKTVQFETEAKLFIQDLFELGVVQFVWSYMLDYENSANPDSEVSQSIAKWKNLAKLNISETEQALEQARQLRESGLGIKDSLHIACAQIAGAKYFVTTDRGIIKKRQLIGGTSAINPIEFVRILEERNEG